MIYYNMIIDNRIIRLGLYFIYNIYNKPFRELRISQSVHKGRNNR